MAVVAPDTKVIGFEDLYCADSSLFPRITNGNLNAPSIMTGEKASDHILGKAPLPKANDVPFTHPSWQEISASESLMTALRIYDGIFSDRGSKYAVAGARSLKGGD